MRALLGGLLLLLALLSAGIQSLLPLIGFKRSAIPAAWAQCFFLMLSGFCLIDAFIHNDFSIFYVAEHSCRALPVFYKIAAVWGGHEGSLLLWVTLLSGWTIAFILSSKPLPQSTRVGVVTILGWISLGFLLFLVFTSNPFLPFMNGIPENGLDLNPLLQDPGMALHPPMLYMGYVGFAVTFALALTALIHGQVDAAWARMCRPWAQAAWVFLTIGITLGSGWAYRVLGWGGWWFWDPVENASFLPWLVGTALMHCLIAVEKRQVFKNWALFLSICAFSLSLIGTFLVRSGILTSVHAFAVDPTRGVWMLGFLISVIGSSLMLYAWRAPKIHSGHAQLGWTRETFILFNTVILMVMMLTVLIGTLYPLVLDASGIGKISVGAPYFNTVLLPLMSVLCIFMGIGPLTAWQKKSSHWDPMLYVLGWWFLSALLLGIVLPWIVMHDTVFKVVLGMTLASWLIVTTVQAFIKSGRNYGMSVAHIGLAICAIGVTLSYYTIEQSVRIAVHDHTMIGPYRINFLNVHPVEAVNYTAEQAVFEIKRNEHTVALLTPERRHYHASDSMLSKAAILPGVWRDIYIALGESFSQNDWIVRIYIKPFVRWIWAGGFLMALGGILSICRKRHP